jgi:Phosphotransferase enzyme family
MTPADYFLQHGLTANNLQLVEKRSLNEVFISDLYALKLSRPETRDWINHAREAQVALAEIGYGVKTAKPIVWGEDFSIWERINGQTIHGESVSGSFLSDLLDCLELIHNNPFEPMPNEYERLWIGDQSHVEYASSIHELTREDIRKIEDVLLQPTKISKPVFIHGDVFADNIFSNDQGDFAALIDWGNAGWHSLERECAFMDPNILEAAISRWEASLDQGLLWKIRLDILLEIFPRGVISANSIQEALSKL